MEESTINGAQPEVYTGLATNVLPKEPGSQTSQLSQTASDYINSQLQLEADAREALPYAFDHCTQPLGPLKQNLFSCLTCNPPPTSPSDPFTSAAVCYSCSIACHGEHTLVELFNRRNFTCDCGTTRLPDTSPCTLRIDPSTGMKGPVHSQKPAEGNTYNQNCSNLFCGCGEVYNPEEEKGTMYQCLGLASEADGGCGEDWWHPECVLGLGRDWMKERQVKREQILKTTANGENNEVLDSLPPEFPDEDDFDTFICYKCVNAVPWIKEYAGSTGFLPPVFKESNYETLVAKTESYTKEAGQSRLAEYRAAQAQASVDPVDTENAVRQNETGTSKIAADPAQIPTALAHGLKRTADDAEFDSSEWKASKRAKSEAPRYHDYLPPAPKSIFSLFCKDSFRDHFCRCPSCYSNLKLHPQLLEEEESYEPPLSSSSGAEAGNGEGSIGSKSLLDRGEAALSNVDRVRAIEGVMVYNHLKDKVKSFLQPFAESGHPVGAEDIKAYFEKLRGDEQGIRKAAATNGADGGDGGEDNRREQSGY